MRWHDQIEACTNAADVSAVWKYLKLYEKELYKTHYKHVTPTARLLALQLMSPMRRGRVDDEWIARIACNAIQKALHELAAPGFKVQSARKICYLSAAQ